MSNVKVQIKININVLYAAHAALLVQAATCKQMDLPKQQVQFEEQAAVLHAAICNMEVV